MARVLRLAPLAAGVTLLGACATIFSSDPDPVPTEGQFQEGISALERGDFRAADAAFREVASRCESGDRGRSALLLLSTSALDVRNPWLDPDRAAYLAAAYLRLPDAPPEELSLARTLYIMALDRGAHPLSQEGEAVGEEDPPVSGLAGRFGRCDSGGVVERVRLLPAHPGQGTADRLSFARAEADSLRLKVDALTRSLGIARAQIGELTAELERIRKLLKGGGGSQDPGAS